MSDTRSTRRRARVLVVAALSAVVLAGCAAVGSWAAIERGQTDAPAGISAGTSGVTQADGYIEIGEHVSPFDDVPAIANLDPELLDALRRAATDAAEDGTTMWVTDGWRSDAYQQLLWEGAVAEYGSESEAEKWVKRPGESSHASGGAVDIGPTDGYSWLSRWGADYGLCQTYANEMWHFELAVAPGGVCPQALSDASGR